MRMRLFIFLLSCFVLPVSVQAAQDPLPIILTAPAQGSVTITITIETHPTQIPVPIPTPPIPPVPPLPVADTTPPSIPTHVVATAISPTQISVTWEASSDNLVVVGYHVSRDGVRVSPSTGLSIVMEELLPSTAYSVSVEAFDAAGNTSLPSEHVLATTLTIPPPPLPPILPPIQGEVFQTHHDRIPHFAQFMTIQSVKDGPWSDPRSWSPQRVPAPADIVQITHAITYDSLSGDVDTIGIAAGGLVSFSSTQSTKLLLRTLLIQPQGTLVVGTVDAPIPPQFTAEIVVKDLPFDVTRDPAQYGHGIVAVDGIVHMHGAKISQPFVRLSSEKKAGENIGDIPSEWKSGERIVVADSRQLTSSEVQPNDQVKNVRRHKSQTEVVTVQNDKSTTALQFSHLGAYDTKGALSFLPHMGNVSRNITITSQNPTGVRGHLFFTGTSDIDIRYVSFVNLGRTEAEPLHNTLFDERKVVTRIGKNQIGRYPLHMHHVYGVCAQKPFQYTLIGNVIEESGRWGLAIHDSHYGLIQDNIIYNIKGGGIATEDGSETGNVFEHNFIVKSENDTLITQAEANSNTDPLGRKGNGFWLRGPGSALRNNVIADTREGIGLYTGSEEGGFPDGPEMPVNIPTHPCANTTIAGQYTTIEKVFQVPNQEFSGNEIYSTSEMGIGSWVNTGVGKPMVNTVIWHAYSQAIFMKYTDPIIDGLIIRNKGGHGIALNQSNNFGYGASLLKNADIQGVDVIYQRAGQLTLAPNWRFIDSYFTSRRGFLLDANGQENGAQITQFFFINVRFDPLPGMSLRAMTTTFNPLNGDRVNYPRRLSVQRYQGNPADNFQVYFAAQAPETLAYRLAEFLDLGPGLSGCPLPLTNQACWDAHKVATFMQVAPCTDILTHPEITGFTCK